MAAVDKWRTCLNENSFCKKLRENNARESKRKLQTESKGLVVVNDNDLFIWDNHASHLIFFNLKNIFGSSDRQNRFQVLQCTDTPRFDVDGLVWNVARTHLALWGQLGVTVLELPQKWGKFAEFEGGKDTVSCKCVCVGEHFFSGHRGVKLLQVRWHAASTTDSHVVFLTSDNLISIYDILDPERPTQTIYLGDNEPSFGMSLTRPSISSALGDNVVSFDFGPCIEVQKKYRSERTGQRDNLTVWPLYCVRGNGDVIVAYTDLSARPLKLPVAGPLLMHPPAEDNYGTDACSILCLSTTPTVVVVSTCDGRLLHCVLLPRELEDTTLQSDSSYRSATEESLFYPPDEVLLYVYETIELELSLTTPSFADNPTPEEMFTCPVRLVRDMANSDRYHCSHAAGVHTVALPWINNYQRFCTEDDEEEDTLPEHQDSVVEHLICTKPLPNSDMRHRTNASTLLSSSRGQTIPSPLRKISRQPFDERIRTILQRVASNPLLKSHPNAQVSQQECFQLLSRSTQIFREEYIQKQDLARQEIKRRVSILKEQKTQQERDIQQLHESRNIVMNGAEHLANMCEECKEKQEDILKRVEGVMRKLQARIPFLSDSERNMKRELENMEERLDTYKRNLEQLRVKRDYQTRQIQQSRKSNQPSPVIKNSQMTQLREVLKQEGDELSEVMKKINQLKMDVNL